ncbi:hypothetical protein PVAP13_3KG063652 [Panicum virgatum]|uniref:Uncharacterized protein n=1 Tax=Panicum virgatum TaxID=38727 RepID=A0A8T0UPD0_PANVG|nr:hypothetical protein PVAP13_3KG063652 [Panicum virgatum]
MLGPEYSPSECHLTNTDLVLIPGRRQQTQTDRETEEGGGMGHGQGAPQRRRTSRPRRCNHHHQQPSAPGRDAGGGAADGVAQVSPLQLPRLHRLRRQGRPRLPRRLLRLRPPPRRGRAHGRRGQTAPHRPPQEAHQQPPRGALGHLRRRRHSQQAAPLRPPPRQPPVVVQQQDAGLRDAPGLCRRGGLVRGGGVVRAAGLRRARRPRGRGGGGGAPEGVRGRRRVPAGGGPTPGRAARHGPCHRPRRDVPRRRRIGAVAAAQDLVGLVRRPGHYC